MTNTQTAPSTATPAKNPDVIDGHAAAALIGVSYQLVLKLFHAGDLPGFKAGKLIKFHRRDVEAYMQPKSNDPELCG